jgi:hypothetical protein
LPRFIARGKVAVLTDLVGADVGTAAGAGLLVRFGAGARVTAMTGAARRLGEGLTDGIPAGEGRGLTVAVAVGITTVDNEGTDAKGAVPGEGALVEEAAEGVVEALREPVLARWLQALSATREATARTAVGWLTRGLPSRCSTHTRQCRPR